MFYNKYSDYLKEKYGEKVYKLPINLPITCPNRLNDNTGCSFCSDKGTGFEASDAKTSIVNQLEETKEKISKRYGAKKYIAYFQNYTNTFMGLSIFKERIEEAAMVEDIVEISISTRPDCIHTSYLDVLKEVEEKYHISITIELGLQTVNYKTLKRINRGHTLAEFIDAVLAIQSYGFTICSHVILNLPYDDLDDIIEMAKILSSLQINIVKIHSLYIAKNTTMCEEYLAGDLTLCSKEEYLERLAEFVEHLAPNMIIERLFSRIPKDDMVFSNWNTSWWKLQDEFIEKMISEQRSQGEKFNYLNGSALKFLD